MEIGLGLLIGIGVTLLLEGIIKANTYLRNRFWDRPQGIFGYHIHHSSYGIVCFFIASYVLLFDLHLSLFLIGMGVGIIAAHTYTDKRLVFIEKI